MSFHRDDVIITHRPDGSAIFDVGCKEAWTHFWFEMSAEDMEAARNLPPFETMKCRSNEDKLEIYHFVRGSEDRLFIKYREKMFGGGYETENVEVDFAGI